MLFTGFYPLLDDGWAIPHTQGFTSYLAEKMQTLLGERTLLILPALLLLQG